jgi:hypothetical protein
VRAPVSKSLASTRALFDVNGLVASEIVASAIADNLIVTACIGLRP